LPLRFISGGSTGASVQPVIPASADRRAFKENSMGARDIDMNRLRPSAITAALALACAQAPVQAQTPPDATVDLPAGLACSGFDLRIEIWAADHRQYREFFDRHGTLVRIIEAGRGHTLKLTNVNSAASLSLRPNGSVSHSVPSGPPGNFLVKATGHNLIILFPTDTPPGPSTTLYVGQIQYSQDPNFTFMVKKLTGTQTDLCAALSG
jgi:hypothetical protein